VTNTLFSQLARPPGADEHALSALGVVGVVLIIAVLAPWLAPHDPRVIIDMNAAKKSCTVGQAIGRHGP